MLDEFYVVTEKISTVGKSRNLDINDIINKIEYIYQDNIKKVKKLI